MRSFMDRYCLRLVINAGCFAFIFMSETGERAFIAIAFMVGMAVEPWIQGFEKRHEGMKTQIEIMTEAVQAQQHRGTFI